MGKYYVSGYSTPDDVNSRDDVKRYQKMLGVTVDGIWGKNTQAAYEKYMGGSKSGSTASSDGFDWESAAQRISTQLEKILRPAVDEAIQNRKKAAETNRAELDADAAARGMEGSTFVSSMKERENSYTEEDIASLEASYQSNLASTLYSSIMSLYDTYSENRIAEENLKLERERMAQEQAQFEAQLAAQKSRYSAGSTSQSEDSTQMPKMNYNYSDYYMFVESLSDTDKKMLFEDDGIYWQWARQQIITDIGEEGYYVLYNNFCKQKGQKSGKKSDGPTQEVK